MIASFHFITFSASFEMIVEFSLLMWWSTSFWMLNQPCIPGISSFYHGVFSMYYWIWFCLFIYLFFCLWSDLLKCYPGFMQLFVRDIGVCFSYYVLTCFLVLRPSWLLRITLELSPFPFFPESLSKSSTVYSLSVS